MYEKAKGENGVTEQQERCVMFISFYLALLLQNPMKYGFR